MATILVVCPTTLKSVSTGLSAVEATFGRPEYDGGRFRCEACQEVHTWVRADAWVAKKPAHSVIEKSLDVQRAPSPRRRAHRSPTDPDKD